jgi:hypothetical protein
MTASARPSTPLRALLLILLLTLALPAVGVRAAEPATPAPEEPAPRHDLGAHVDAVKQETRRQVGAFAEYATGLFETLASNGAVAWPLMVAAVLVGLISATYGWTLVKNMLVPFAPVWGMATGGVMAFCLIETLYRGHPTWWRLLLFGAGLLAGLAVYLFSALRAKPIAAFLVVLSPFLIGAAFLFPTRQLLGLFVFIIGVGAGFAAMIQVRPLAIISTSLFGAGCMLWAYGLLAELIDAAGPLHVVADSFQWLLNKPLFLLLVWGLVGFMGMNFQFSTGPRGTLED